MSFSNKRAVINFGAISSLLTPKIPIVVQLFTDGNFSGAYIDLIEDCPSLNLWLTRYIPSGSMWVSGDQIPGFNDRTSSIKIRPGPNYDPNLIYPVSFFADANYQGGSSTLNQGSYPLLPAYQNDKISSVKFLPPQNIRNYNPNIPTPINKIPLIVELYENVNFDGGRMICITNQRGISWPNCVTSVRVRKGPTFVPPGTVKLYAEGNFSGRSIELGLGDYPDIGFSHGFSDATNSVAISGAINDLP